MPFGGSSSGAAMPFGGRSSGAAMPFGGSSSGAATLGISQNPQNTKICYLAKCCHAPRRTDSSIVPADEYCRTVCDEQFRVFQRGGGTWRAASEYAEEDHAVPSPMVHIAHEWVFNFKMARDDDTVTAVLFFLCTAPPEGETRREALETLLFTVGLAVLGEKFRELQLLYAATEEGVRYIFIPDRRNTAEARPEVKGELRRACRDGLSPIRPQEGYEDLALGDYSGVYDGKFT
ncbi:hypothetical protein FOZ63_016132, partial [Perkinsus olseni]